MSIHQFEIDQYTVALGQIFTVEFGIETVTAVGRISCEAEEFFTILVYFLDEESPVPPPAVSDDGNSATLFVQKDMMPVWTDLLRNEKTMYGYINTARPSSTRITNRLVQI